jgi:hypothetical protein
MVYNVMPPVRRGGLYSMSSAPKGRTPEDQNRRTTQDAALELLVVGVILAMMLILSLR